MTTRVKCMICVLIFMVGSVGNVYFSTTLHYMLSGKMRTLTRFGFLKGIESIGTSRQHGLLFLCLQGYILILVIAFYLTNMRPYQSKLTIITPEIKTPVAVGQLQHGSAKWQTDEEKDKEFDSFLLDPNDTVIQEVLQSGYDGIDFTKESGKEE